MTEATVRPSRLATSVSARVPSNSSSAGDQRRKVEPKVGILSNCLLSSTAVSVRPNSRASSASGLEPSSRSSSGRQGRHLG